MQRLMLLTFCLLLAAGCLSAADKKLMHCFFFTPEAGATDAQWQAFFMATDDLPGKIPGLTNVWYGKLARPMAVLSTSDAEARKKLAAGEKDVPGPINRVVREWGVCMEMDGPDALKAYAPHPEHKKWEEVYSKVRQPGTTTVDIVGQ